MGMRFQRTITVLLVVYVFDFMADTYKPRPDMPKDLPLQLYNARKALQLIDQGDKLSMLCAFCDAAPVLQSLCTGADGAM